MKTLWLFLLLQAYWDPLPKSAGETITLVYDDDIEAGDLARFILYRKTGTTSTPVKLAEQQANTFQVRMPDSYVKQYRFFVVPVTLNSAGTVTARGPASNEVLVVRK